MTIEKIEVPKVSFRQGEIVRAGEGESDDVPQTVELAFSSEEPVERYGYREVLGHKSGEVDASFMESGRAPLLADHRASLDHTIGIIESVSFSGGKGRATVRFGKSDRAQDIAKRVADGEISNVSVGYSIKRMELVKDDKDGLPTYRATSWKPLEISLVSVPADHSVGIGRTQIEQGETITLELKRKELAMAGDNETRPEDPDTNAQTERAVEKAQKAETERVREILTIGQKHNCADKAEKAIRAGLSAADFATQTLFELGERGQEQISAGADIGLNKKERQQFSFVNALRALANPGDKAAQEAARFEMDCSNATAEKRGKPATGILVPPDVMREASPTHQRNLNAGTAAQGGALVADNLLSGSFIDLLRARAVVMQSGARMLNDLQGNIAIPRLTSGATAYWVGEGGDITKSAAAFDQVTMTPKTVGAFTDYTRKLLLQSSIDIEALVREDLARVIGLEIDKVALHGTGTANQPGGVSALTGVNSTNFAAAAPTWAEIVGMETEVATDNADMGSLGYIINPAMRGGFKTTEKASGTAQFIWENGGTVNGYRAGVTTQVLSNNAFFGNWADLLIGTWSGLDLTVDPYTNATSGTVRVVAMQDVDIAGRHPQSFCHSFHP
ncbi:phage major capsid protein [Roseibium sp.]|uniref:phage major capsid protein n=1 Tax=Roseibium sp. TaxID=1936156 RepID=UPI003BAADC1F